MKLQIKATGVEELRRAVANVAECAVAGTLTRRGLSEVGRIVTRAQKNMAPVRKGRLSLRKLDKRLQKGIEIGKATRLSTTKAPSKMRKLGPDFIGPGREIKPGLIKRSIGYRVIRSKGMDAQFTVKMGMNVGKKRSNNNFAPHAAFVGSGTQQRYSNAAKSAFTGPQRVNRGRMPQNRFIADATLFASGAALAALDKAVKEDMVRAYKLSLRASRVVMQ
jgi:hypothetical protein